MCVSPHSSSGSNSCNGCCSSSSRQRQQRRGAEAATSNSRDQRCRSFGKAVLLSLFLYVSMCVPVSWVYSSSMLSQQRALHLHTGDYLQCSSSNSCIAFRTAVQVRAGESEMEARGKVLSNPVWKTGMVMGLSDTGKAQVGEQHRARHKRTQQHCSIYSALVDIGAYMQQVQLVAGSAAVEDQHCSTCLPCGSSPSGWAQTLLYFACCRR